MTFYFLINIEFYLIAVDILQNISIMRESGFNRSS